MIKSYIKFKKRKKKERTTYLLISERAMKIQTSELKFKSGLYLRMGNDI